MSGVADRCMRDACAKLADAFDPLASIDVGSKQGERPIELEHGGSYDNVLAEIMAIVDGPSPSPAGGEGDVPIAKSESADWWVCDRNQDRELRFACGLLFNRLPEACIPVWRDTGGTSVLFMPEERIKKPYALTKSGACLPFENWQDALFDSENMAICFPSPKLHNRNVLVTAISLDDALNYGESGSGGDSSIMNLRNYLCLEKSRHVLFIAPTIQLLSLRENKWWDNMAYNGRFHIVLCHLSRAEGGAYDVSTPVDGALKNFKCCAQQFYPGAWRHVLP